MTARLLTKILLEKIFDPYASGKDGQFGLGLAITRQVMDMHGARIRASNEERGVAFYIEMN
jgi:two-component system sensor histidine kinase CssS